MTYPLLWGKDGPNGLHCDPLSLWHKAHLREEVSKIPVVRSMIWVVTASRRRWARSQSAA